MATDANTAEADSAGLDELRARIELGDFLFKK